MKFLILGHIDDLAAMAVFARLSQRHGSQQVRLISADALIYAPLWRHHLQGPTLGTTIYLTDGTVLESNQIGVVFNRLRYAEPLQFADVADRQYASMELYALWLSWLESLPCPVLNAPVPQGLGDRDWGQLGWRFKAAAAELPVQHYAFSSDPRRYQGTEAVPHRRAEATGGGRATLVPVATPVPIRVPAWYLEAVEAERYQVLIAGTQVVGTPGADFTPELIALRRLTDCEILQVEFARALAPDPQPWRVTGINAFPTSLDNPGIDSIVQLLEQAATGASVSR